MTDTTHSSASALRSSNLPVQRILVVEDELLIGFDTTGALADAGFDVVWATDGRQGCETALQQPFDLIITDYVMPKMDGLELIRTLRSSSAH